MTSSSDPLGRSTSYGYDPMNRRTTMTQPGGGTATWDYDPAGQLTSTTSAAGYVSSFGYDSLGRMTQASDGLGNTTFSSYDAVGRLTSRTDANGGTYGFTYDPVGRLTSETDPLGGSIQFSYDAAGQRTSFVNPNGNSRSWSYDAGGRVTSHADELGRITSYSYDPVGRQLSMTDPRGISTNRVFDAAGQLVSETAGGESRAFAYDSGGRLASFSDITGTTSMGWDPMGRVTSVNSTAGNVGYSYNAAGERTSMSQPEGSTSYTWNGNSDMVGLTDWRGDTASFSPDADGRMLTATLSNGVSSAYGYDAAGRLTSIGHTGPAGLIDSFNYTLDNNGNRTAVTSNEGTETYTLDALNRITAAAYPDGTNEAFNYDAAGNRVSHTQTDGTTVSFTHDAAGQLVSDSTGINYTYDSAGNLTGTSAGDTYTYNPWGNLTEATLDGVTTTSAFDATGTRVQVDGVDQLWDRTGYGTLISSSAGDNFLHVPGGGILRDDTDWILRDAVGSVRHATDTTGAVTASAAFTAFGEPRATGSSVFGFAGEQTDPNSLIHLRARGYNPALGSFTSYDPIQPGGPSTAGWNHYTYSANNPTTWTDPTGEITLAQTGILLGAVALTVAAVLLLTGGPAQQDAAEQIAEAVEQAATNAASNAQGLAGTIWDAVKPDEITVIEIGWAIGTSSSDLPAGWPGDLGWSREQLEQAAAAAATAAATIAATTDLAGPQRNADGEYVFYHGTNSPTAAVLVAPGGTIAAAVLGNWNFAGEKASGFYLATVLDDAWFFANRRALEDGGTRQVVKYSMSRLALGALHLAGARFSEIGGDFFPGGLELYLPPKAYPVFDALRLAGKIKASVLNDD